MNVRVFTDNPMRLPVMARELRNAGILISSTCNITIALSPDDRKYDLDIVSDTPNGRAVLHKLSSRGSVQKALIFIAPEKPESDTVIDGIAVALRHFPKDWSTIPTLVRSIVEGTKPDHT